MKQKCKRLFLIVFVCLSLLTDTNYLAAQPYHGSQRLDGQSSSSQMSSRESQAQNGTFVEINNTALALVARWPFGRCEAVAANANYLFMGNGSILQTYDATNPFAPILIGEYWSAGAIADIQLYGNYAIVCTYDSLIALDLSTPDQPLKIGGARIGSPGVGGAYRACLADTVAFVLSLSGFVTPVGISDPNKMHKYLGSLTVGGYAFAATPDRYIYVGGWGTLPSFMEVYQAHNLDSLTRLSSFYDFAVPGCAAIVDTLLVLGGGNPDGLNIYSIRDPASPHLLGTSRGFRPRAIALKDSVAFLSTDSGLTTISLSDPWKPLIIESVHNRVTYDITQANDRVYAASPSAVYVYGLQGGDSLTLNSVLPANEGSRDVFVGGNLGFLASGESGLWILDLSDTARPRSLSNLLLDGVSFSVIADSQHAYVMNSRGLRIVDISNPKKPSLVGQYNSNPCAMAKSGNQIFLGRTWSVGRDTSIEIVDVADVTQPQLMSAIRSNNEVRGLSVHDSILFVAAAQGGLLVYDCHVPSNPIQISSIACNALAVIAIDSLLYIRSDSLQVVEVQHPVHPSIVGSTGLGYTGGDAPKLSVAGHFLYVADGVGAIYDISKPIDPRWVETFQAGYQGTGICARDNLVYFSDWQTGFWTFRNTLVTSMRLGQDESTPRNYELLQNYPNPFNNETVISWSFPKQQRVTIEVFNVLGQKVATIFRGETTPGVHAARFSGTGLSAGVYFYRLQTETSTWTRSMMYLK